MEDETATCDDCGALVNKEESYVWHEAIVICWACAPSKVKIKYNRCLNCGGSKCSCQHE